MVASCGVRGVWMEMEAAVVDRWGVILNHVEMCCAPTLGELMSRQTTGAVVAVVTWWLVCFWLGYLGEESLRGCPELVKDWRFRNEQSSKSRESI
jgi:hypothetical protein